MQMGAGGEAGRPHFANEGALGYGLADGNEGLGEVEVGGHHPQAVIQDDDVAPERSGLVEDDGSGRGREHRCPFCGKKVYPGV